MQPPSAADVDASPRPINGTAQFERDNAFNACRITIWTEKSTACILVTTPEGESQRLTATHPEAVCLIHRLSQLLLPEPPWLAAHVSDTH